MGKIPASTKGVPTPAEQKATAKAEAATAKAEAVKEPKAPGKIAQILELFKAGKTNKEIVDAGFHATTVAIQVSRYKKANPALYPPVVKVPKEKAPKKVKEAAAVAE